MANYLLYLVMLLVVAVSSKYRGQCQCCRYAVANWNYRFCLLTPNGRSQRLTNCVFDAGLPSQRLAILRTVVNIIRFFTSFGSLFPTEYVKLFDQMERNDGVKVTIYPSYVVKRIPSIQFSEVSH